MKYDDLKYDYEFESSYYLIEKNAVVKGKQELRQSKSKKIKLSIIKNEVIKFEKNNVITWTFELEKPLLKSSDFENLLVKKYLGSFSYYLIAYKVVDKKQIPLEIKSSKLYPLSEKIFDLSNTNLQARGDVFDWAPTDDGGGGDSGCEGQVIENKIEPCNQNGYHEAGTFCCQHDDYLTGYSQHGCDRFKNFPPCGNTCDGTKSLTILDFSHCQTGTYNPPSGPSNDLNDSGTSGSTGGGGGISDITNNTSNDNTENGETLISSPIPPDENDKCPEGYVKNTATGQCVPICSGGKIYDPVTKKCNCPEGKKEDTNGNCVDDCDTSKEDLKKVFPNMPDNNAELLASIINEKGRDFGIDTKEKLQHFLAQAGHETGGFNTLNVTESTYWTAASKLAKTYRKFTIDSTIAANNTDKYYAPDYLQNSSGVANVAMCCKYGNGDVASGDGYKYRGRGLFQLTWKDNYSSFKTWYNNKYNPDIDPVANPNILATNDTLSILSGLWYYKTRVLDKITVNSTTTVSKVTKPINAAKKGLKDRKERFQKAKDSIKCL